MYDIINCLPGLVCYPTSVYACPGGYYCPTPFSLNGNSPSIPCPEGGSPSFPSPLRTFLLQFLFFLLASFCTLMLNCSLGSFCPRGMVAPIPCGFLDDCSYGSRTRKQFIGVLLSGVVVGIVFILFAIFKVVEILHRRKWEAIRKSFSSGISSHGGFSFHLTPLESTALILRALFLLLRF
jgi:hypothetical protein